MNESVRYQSDKPQGTRRNRASSPRDVAWGAADALPDTPEVGSGASFATSKAKLRFLACFSLLLILTGFALCPSVEKIIGGIRNILLHPAMIDFDSFYWAGNMGAPFVQAGLCALIITLMYGLTGTEITGIHLTAGVMAVGFSFYGKTILSMWFPMAGVFLYALSSGKKPKEVTALAVFSACLGPVFGALSFFTEPLGIGSFAAVMTGAVCAILAGWLMAFFAAFLPKLHGGLLLYNAGLAAGCVAALFNALLKATGLSHEAYPYTASMFTEGQNGLLAPLLLSLFAGLILLGLFAKGGAGGLRLLLARSSNTDHLKTYGLGACMVAMGVVGTLAVFYVLLIGGEINGTTFACILTAAGFIAAGSTLRSHAAVALGVIVGAFCTGGIAGVADGGAFLSSALLKLSSRGVILSTIFACGVGPIAGAYGGFAGVIVGIAHGLLVSNTGALHGWMSLYNNAFSLGLLTVFMRPVFQGRWPRASA